MYLNLIFLGHGSKNMIALAEFIYLIDIIRYKYLFINIMYCFLEFSKLKIKNIITSYYFINLIIPLILHSSKHIKHDICQLINIIQLKKKKNIILLTNDLSLEILNIKGFFYLIKNLLYYRKLYFKKNILIVVGRGSTDSDSNSNIIKIARFIFEGCGFIWSETCYTGITFPLFNFTLSLIRKKFNSINIIVIPLLLFIGNLYKNLCNNKIYINNIYITDYLFNNIKIIKYLLKKIKWFFEELVHSICNLCKYKLSSYNENIL